MCWIGKLEDKRIAKTDIKVFKVFRVEPGNQLREERVFKAPFYSHDYHMDTCYTIRDGLKPHSPSVDPRNYYIHEGYHSYLPSECTWERTTNFYGRQVISVIHHHPQYRCLDNALAIYEGYDYGDNYNRLSVVECTIPRGSEYWVNDNGEVVSDSIILNKKL